MIKISKFTLIFFVVILGISSLGYATDTKDSARAIVINIGKAYADKKISDQLFLDSVHHAMRSFNSLGINFNQQELLQMLEEYRQVIWNNKHFTSHKRTYYSLLSNQAQMAGRDGEMLYYAEKIGRLEKELTGKFSITALTIEVDYYNTQMSFQKGIDLFTVAQKDILNQLKNAAKDSTKAEDIVQISILLNNVAEAAYKVKDTVLGKVILEGLQLAEEYVKQRYPKDSEIVAYTKLNSVMALADKAKALDDNGLQESVFRTMESMLLDTTVPDYLKNYIHFNIVNKKLFYFLKQKINDSAAFYLKILTDIRKDDGSAINKFVIGQAHAKYLFNMGRYKESADTLGNSVKYLDSTYIQIVKDINEMMYAQAKAEDQQFFLNEAAVENERKAELIRWGTSAGILLLVLGVGSFVFIRQRQRKKFLEFKLNMARNIHDETGPALLYAKSLAKSCKVIGDDEKMRAELENHIENTMAVMRSLSHDLKSDKLYSIGSLIKETDSTLKKLKNLNVFNYEIKERLKENRFISHYQFSQLKAVLQECITNSIKHAQFDRIDISFIETVNKLAITYNDNGKGWESNPGDGIGMSNMRERVRLVNGDFKIDNKFPEGYSIQMLVPLR